jgi:hypothetical protein
VLITAATADVFDVGTRGSSWTFTFWGWRRDTHDKGLLGYRLTPVVTLHSNLIEFIDWTVAEELPASSMDL